MKRTQGGEGICLNVVVSDEKNILFQSNVLIVAVLFVVPLQPPLCQDPLQRRHR